MENNQVTHIAYVLDDSGSMRGLRTQALRAFNDMIAADQAAAVGLVSARVFLFTNRQRIPEIRAGLLQQITLIDPAEYRANGNDTPLVSATIKAIKALDSMPGGDSQNVAFLVKVITDGYENSSNTFDLNSFPGMLNRLNATGRWTITFSCPTGAVEVLARFGVPRGNILPWEQTEQGVEELRSSQVGATQSYFTARAKGVTATRQYFEVNADSLTEKSVSKSCKNVQGNFRSWLVDREIRLDTFISSKGVNFAKGRSYYQLTKKEKVQPDKDIILKRKKGRALYSGDTRGVLGMPSGVHLNLDPGNVGEWEIYVLSNSDNRLLVRGSRVLYRIS